MVWYETHYGLVEFVPQGVDPRKTTSLDIAAFTVAGHPVPLSVVKGLTMICKPGEVNRFSFFVPDGTELPARVLEFCELRGAASEASAVRG